MKICYNATCKFISHAGDTALIIGLCIGGIVFTLVLTFAVCILLMFCIRYAAHRHAQATESRMTLFTMFFTFTRLVSNVRLLPTSPDVEAYTKFLILISET